MEDSPPSLSAIFRAFKKLWYDQMLAVMKESNGMATWLLGMGMEIPQHPVDIAKINIVQVALYIPQGGGQDNQRQRQRQRQRGEKMKAAG